MLAEKSEPTVGDLLGTLANSTASLMRQEVRLVTTEMAQKATHAGRAVGMVGLGGAVLHAGVLVLAVALVFGLAAVVPTWLSAVIVGALATLTGAMMLAKGLGTLRNLDLVPRQTLNTLKDDGAWVKEKLDERN